MIKTIILLSVGLYVSLFQAEVNAESLTIKQNLPSNLNVECVLSDSLFKESVLTDLNLKKLDSILANLIFFEQEVAHFYLLKKAAYQIFFDKNQNLFSNLLISASHPALKGNIEYHIHKVLIDKNFNVITLNFSKKNLDAEIMNYDIYNITFDAQGNILKKIVISSSNNPVFCAIEKGEKFIEGKVIEYKQFNNSKMPTSYKISTFIFSKAGKMINVQVKESLNRTFNEQGLLTGESVRETKYSYSNDSSNYSIYNVKFFDYGQLKRYDLVFSHKDKDKFDQAKNYEFEFVSYDSNKLLASKVVKRFFLKDRKKFYLDGEELFLEWNIHKKLKSSKEQHFIFKKDDSSGAFKKIYTNASYNDKIMHNDKQQVTSEQIVQTVFDPSYDGSLEYIESFREVHYGYQDKHISNITVNFFDFGNNYQKIKMREIIIDIVELMKNKEPAVIKVVINDNISKEDSYEQTIIQDCSYTINEAIYGELFTLPLKNKEAVISKVLSEK